MKISRTAFIAAGAAFAVTLPVLGYAAGVRAESVRPPLDPQRMLYGVNISQYPTYPLEVFEDQRTGNLVYIYYMNGAQAPSIAVVPANQITPKQIAALRKVGYR